MGNTPQPNDRDPTDDFDEHDLNEAEMLAASKDELRWHGLDDPTAKEGLVLARRLDATQQEKQYAVYRCILDLNDWYCAQEFAKPENRWAFDHVQLVRETLSEVPPEELEWRGMRPGEPLKKLESIDSHKTELLQLADAYYALPENDRMSQNYGQMIDMILESEQVTPDILPFLSRSNAAHSFMDIGPTRWNEYL